MEDFLLKWHWLEGVGSRKENAHKRVFLKGGRGFLKMQNIY